MRNSNSLWQPKALIRFLGRSLAAGALSGSALAATAFANTITFETAQSPNGVFTGPVAEDGFTYSLKSGDLLVNNTSNPGQAMQGDAVRGF